jgi:phosphoribosylformimino-5-aminoimidazole carboxamide ribotide isomerase
MEIIPVIEIKAGKSIRKTPVRLEQPNLLTDDPLAIGKRWVAEGAKRLHVVDIDGTRTGMPSPQHLVQIRDLIRRLTVPIQLDSSIHNREVIDRMITSGVARVVLSITSLTDPLSGEWFRLHGEKLIVPIPARGGMLIVSGGSPSDAAVQNFVESLFQRGARRFQYRDVAHDGSTAEPALPGIKNAVRWARVPVSCASALTDLRDITELARAGVESVLLGQALYQGKIRLADAIAMADSAVRPGS